jgi:hypothetical protein
MCIRGLGCVSEAPSRLASVFSALGCPYCGETSTRGRGTEAPARDPLPSPYLPLTSADAGRGISSAGWRSGPTASRQAYRPGRSPGGDGPQSPWPPRRYRSGPGHVSTASGQRYRDPRKWVSRWCAADGSRGCDGKSPLSGMGSLKRQRFGEGGRDVPGPERYPSQATGTAGRLRIGWSLPTCGDGF